MFEGLFRPLHLLLILLIVLIIFGAGRLPEIGEGLGKSIRAFKKAISGEDEQKDKSKPGEHTDDKKSQ
ncbi:MAG TPA: twin-arginine translocase TatA/TatE family subunit [Nitrospirota bacterium]|nr:twin-arginine translocase TatA/TatE family subunit [Nitrospirota bacterium]